MINPTTPIDPRLLRSIQEVGRLGYEAITLYKPNANVNLLTTPYNQVRIAQNKPFLVLHCIQDSNPKLPKEAVYKAWVGGNDTGSKASNEVVFLSQFVPLFLKRLPKNIRHKITFPSFLTSGTEPHFFSLREYLHGSTLGAIDWVKDDALNLEDIDTLAEVVHVINSFTKEELERKHIGFRNLELGYHVDALEVYLKEMKFRLPEVRPILGEKVFDDLVQNLPKLKEWIAARPNVLISGDMNPSNIIKMPSGILGLIDYERVGLGNIGADHALIIAWLYKNPELRDRYLQKTRELNPNDPDLIERIRIEYIYLRAIAGLSAWARFAKQAKTENWLAQCNEAIAIYKEQITEAINREGIWKSLI